MNKAQRKRFQLLYQEHVNALHRQGKARQPAQLIHTPEPSTVKVDRNGLQFFYQYVLNKNWVWVDIVKPPKKTIIS